MLQEVCIACGWHGEFYPDSTTFAGPGGELTCPACSAAKRNRGLESYGAVHILKFDSDTNEYNIICSRCFAFHKVGDVCTSKSCKRIPLPDRVRYDIKRLPAWLLPSEVKDYEDIL